MLASDIPISKTKIILPRRRPELLSRARLLNILYERLDRKLIIISAAAGYGKTSVLIDLAAHSELSFCWLSLDPLDRELPRFIAYFIAALTERFPQFGNRSRSVLDGLTSLEDGMERLLVTLVNEIQDDIHEHFVLVLDDFHLLDESEPILYFVNRFVQLIGENCHLVLSTRTLPNLLDIPLLVAREEVGGLDFSDLSFQPEEIQALLAQNRQIHLSDADARKLVEATEGWITGLQFADLSEFETVEKPLRASHGIGVSVFDYLGQQVLEQQSKSLQVFMLRSSLLEEFDPELCEAVLAPLYSEVQDWPKLIEMIVQKNLFTQPVGADGHWVRYHHLFRDYLQQRFRKDCREEVDPILRRLAQFHETQGEWEKAYQIYKQLDDINALADLIERAGIPMYQHAMLTLESWLKDLPPSLLNNRPGLLSLRGVVATMKGNASEGVSLLDRAIAGFREQKENLGLALALLRRGNASNFLGSYQDAIHDADEAMQIAEMRDGLQWIYADALRIKGLSLFRQGHTLEAIEPLEKAFDIYVREHDTATVPLLLMETGVVYATVGHYDRAKISYGQALKIWRQTGNLSRQANLLNNLGFLYYQLGEYEQAAQSLEEGLLCAQRSSDRRMEAWILLSLGDLYSEIEDFEIAAQNYGRANDLTEQLGESFLMNYLTLARANLSLLKREPLHARQILTRAATTINAGNSIYEYGLYELMHGRLSLQEGQFQQASAALKEAKHCFSEDGREMESIWSYVWLAAAYCQDGQRALAAKEFEAVLDGQNQIKHSAIVAARQAGDWLETLRNDREMRSILRGLFEKSDRLDDQLPGIRRQLRRMARTIEVPSPRLVIHAFGPGQVWINDRPITISEWQTQSVRGLFFYFLAARKPLTREQIGGTLWPNTDEPGKFRMRFKNEIYRLRCAVGQDAIIFQHEYYQFNASMDHEYDVEAFESFLARARSASAAAEQIDFYQKAVDLVEGQYLEDLNEDWVLLERERLRQIFLSASLTLAELYFKEGQSPKTIEICDQALAQDRTLEAAYRLMMQVYHRQGDKPSVIHAYRTCEQNMQNVFGLPPSEETQRLYHELTS